MANALMLNGNNYYGNGERRYGEANEYQFVENSYGRRYFDVKRVEPKPVIKREQLQPTCFTCEVKGHKSPDCPKMVKRAVKAVRIDQSPSLLAEVEGNVAGKE